MYSFFSFAKRFNKVRIGKEWALFTFGLHHKALTSSRWFVAKIKVRRGSVTRVTIVDSIKPTNHDLSPNQTFDHPSFFFLIVLFYWYKNCRTKSLIIYRKVHWERKTTGVHSFDLSVSTRILHRINPTGPSLNTWASITILHDWFSHTLDR
jgi:hypothetical protein